MPGPGPRKLVDGPARLGPPISLLSSVDGIETNDPADPESLRWLNGIRYRTLPCSNGYAGPVGCKPDGDDHTFTKEEDRTGEETATDPFLVYVGETCSTFGWSANNYVERATGWLGAVEAWQVEREFWTGTQAKAGTSAGVEYPDDQWLAQTETSVVLSGELSARRGMGVLQEALGNCAGGGRGMIHVPAFLLATLMEANLVRRDGNRYLDGRDNVVVVGNGYPGTSVAGAAPAAGAGWAFATGMVRIFRDDVVVLPGSMAEAVNRMESGQHNTVTFRAERHYLVDWDRCCHFAVQITSI